MIFLFGNWEGKGRMRGGKGDSYIYLYVGEERCNIGMDSDVIHELTRGGEGWQGAG